MASRPTPSSPAVYSRKHHRPASGRSASAASCDVPILVIPCACRVRAVVTITANMTTLEKNVPSPTSIWRLRISRPLAPIRSPSPLPPALFFLLHLLGGLPEKEVRADGRAEDRHQRRPGLRAVKPRRPNRVREDRGPRRTEDDRGDDVREEEHGQPFQHLGDGLVVQPHH